MPKTEFQLGAWKARQELAKTLLAITQLNDPDQVKIKVRKLAMEILNTEE